MSWLIAQLRESERHMHDARKFVDVEMTIRMRFGIAEALDIQILEVRQRRLLESQASVTMWPVWCVRQIACLLTRGIGEIREAVEWSGTGRGVRSIVLIRQQPE